MQCLRIFSFSFLTRRLKLKDIQFTIASDKETQTTFTIEKLEPQNV